MRSVTPSEPNREVAADPGGSGSGARRFCRFAPRREGNEYGVRVDDPDGFCLSCFLVLSPRGAPDEVLVGRMNPTAPWPELGGLDSARVSAHAHGWVLPATQLLMREAPREAAERIRGELLGGLKVALDPPMIFSLVGPPRRFPHATGHWDLIFLFRGHYSEPAPAVPEVWRELGAVDLRKTSRTAFARSHEEVLDLVGMSPRSEP